MRSHGGAKNARKVSGIGFMFLQFFVDEVQSLSCRADTQLLMTHARELRAQLIAEHWAETELPELFGPAGRMWVSRWRRDYNIGENTVGMKRRWCAAWVS